MIITIVMSKIQWIFLDRVCVFRRVHAGAITVRIIRQANFLWSYLTPMDICMAIVHGRKNHGWNPVVRREEAQRTEQNLLAPHKAVIHTNSMNPIWLEQLYFWCCEGETFNTPAITSSPCHQPVSHVEFLCSDSVCVCGCVGSNMNEWWVGGLVAIYSC